MNFLLYTMGSLVNFEKLEARQIIYFTWEFYGFWFLLLLMVWKVGKQLKSQGHMAIFEWINDDSTDEAD